MASSQRYVSPRDVLLLVVMTSLVDVTSSSRHHGNMQSSNARTPVVVNERPTIKYANFDEYLMSIGTEGERQRSQNQVNKDTNRGYIPRRPVPATDDEDLVESSGDDDTSSSQVAPALAPTSYTTTTAAPARRPEPPSPSWDLDILGYFRDVPREHWSCCMLGKLAGDKGFHCYAGFYAARIQTRNLNRAHNKKMHFHGHDAIPHWGENIMHTFERCVAEHGDEFHKCCYAATVEKRELAKWSRYIGQGQGQEDAEEAQQQLRQRQLGNQRQDHGHRGSNRPHSRAHSHHSQHTD